MSWDKKLKGKHDKQLKEKVKKSLQSNTNHKINIYFRLDFSIFFNWLLFKKNNSTLLNIKRRLSNELCICRFFLKGSYLFSVIKSNRFKWIQLCMPIKSIIYLKLNKQTWTHLNFQIQPAKHYWCTQNEKYFWCTIRWLIFPFLLCPV